MYKLIGYYDYDCNLNRVGELKVEENVVLRLSDNAFVYFIEDNTNYQSYLAWLAEGNEPLPPDPT